MIALVSHHHNWSLADSTGYTPLSHCHFVFSTSVLSLNISDSDMLTITDGDEVTTRILGRYVGGSSPFKLSSTTPDLTITFHSDPAGLVFGKGEGFIINYMGKRDTWGNGRQFTLYSSLLLKIPQMSIQDLCSELS